MKKYQVPKELCRLASAVRTRVYKDNIPADCFCSDKVKANRFEFDSQVFGFMQDAIMAAIEKHTQNEENGARAMTPREAQEIISDAAYILRLYINYSEEMRKLGSGYRATGRKGHSDSAILAQMQAVITHLGSQS